jgi:hypothetical protein
MMFAGVMEANMADVFAFFSALGLSSDMVFIFETNRLKGGENPQKHTCTKC